jgi:excisionase family DNA binding protein
MEIEGVLSIEEAAQRLGRSPQAVRQMAASGDLDAVRRGREWWLDERAVERRRREARGRGRALAPEVAWSVLFLASGEHEQARRVAAEAHHPSRAARWLRTNELSARGSRLRGRARRESFDAHPSEFSRLLARDDVMRTGISAAEEIGLHGGSEAAEFYAPESARPTITDAHALEAGNGGVVARWVPDALWSVIAAARAPRAAVLLDLLENDDPRARREADRALQMVHE